MSFAKYAAVLALTFQAVLREDEAAEDELMEALDDIWFALSPSDRTRVDVLASKFASGELSRSAFIADFAEFEAREHVEVAYGETPSPSVSFALAAAASFSTAHTALTSCPNAGATAPASSNSKAPARAP